MAKTHDPRDLDAREAREHARTLHDSVATLEDREDLKWLMSNPRGRRFIWRTLERTGVFRSPFRNNGLALAHATGWGDYGRFLIDLIHDTCPELYPVMVKEQNTSDDEQRSSSSRR